MQDVCHFHHWKDLTNLFSGCNPLVTISVTLTPMLSVSTYVLGLIILEY